MPYQAVIFDLDGTLLDTIEDIADAVNCVLEKNQYPDHSIEHYKQMVGLGLKQLIVDALPEAARDAATIKRVASEAAEEYDRRWKNKSNPYSGITELLGQLQAKGTQLAVLSNKPHAFTQACVKALLPGTVFDVVLGAQDTMPHKPAPDGALKIAEMLGISVEAILYVGDSKTDMQTARAAGMFAVGVSWGFRAEDELWENGADKIIHAPQELLELV
ncbi:HAD family hydrolase [bacterium]|nr:HAD family hydrolase [bacterium]